MVETVCYDVVFPGQIYQLCGKFGDKGQVPLLPSRDWSGQLEDKVGRGLVVHKHSELPALAEVLEVPDGKVHIQQLSVERRVVQLSRIELLGEKG